MRKTARAASLVALLVVPALAQAQGQAQAKSYSWVVEQLSRYEWNWDQPDFQVTDRWRIMVKPRLEFGKRRFKIGVGGDFEYSSDINYEPTEEFPVLPIFRDNYKSRDARLDLAFLSLKPTEWMELQGGRFVMPVGFTGMIWDRSLRPQGGAITFEAHNSKGEATFSLTGLWARDSHVFEAGDTTIMIGSAQGVFSAGLRTKFTLTGSFVKFTDFNDLQPQIRRQNTRVAGLIVGDYDVVDLVGRLAVQGKVTTEIVVDYAWNTARNNNNKGLWLALALGSTETARARLEYTFAKMDTDVTLAAYDNADFFWGTGWEANRFDLGIKTSDNSSFHVIGVLAKFKDSPDPAERDQWSRRVRVEVRISASR